MSEPCITVQSRETGTSFRFGLSPDGLQAAIDLFVDQGFSLRLFPRGEEADAPQIDITAIHRELSVFVWGSGARWEQEHLGETKKMLSSPVPHETVT